MTTTTYLCFEGLHHVWVYSKDIEELTELLKWYQFPLNSRRIGPICQMLYERRFYFVATFDNKDAAIHFRLSV